MYSSQTCDFYSQLGKCLKRPHPLQVEHFWQESPHLILHLCEAFFQRCFMNLQLIRNDSPAFICLANRRPVFIVGGARHWSDPSTGLFNNPPHPPPSSRIQILYFQLAIGENVVFFHLTKRLVVTSYLEPGLPDSKAEFLF